MVSSRTGAASAFRTTSSSSSSEALFLLIRGGELDESDENADDISEVLTSNRPARTLNLGAIAIKCHDYSRDIPGGCSRAVMIDIPIIDKRPSRYSTRQSLDHSLFKSKDALLVTKILQCMHW